MAQQPKPQTLENYVAGRYMHDLTSTGYQPAYQDAAEMLDDALKMMAAMNQATQNFKQALINPKPLKQAG